MLGSASTTLSLFDPLQISLCMCCSNRPWKLKTNWFPVIGMDKEKSRIVCFSSKKKLGLMDQILDYIEGGPKLRRWYGAPDILPKDGSNVNPDETIEEEEIRDAVLVTDGDSDIGQMVILSLIIKRIRVRALVKNKRAAMEAFGTYVESIAGASNDTTSVKKALRGVRAVICPNDGFVSNVESWKGLEHVILLSQAIMNSNARKLAEEDESALMASGVPYTIIRAGLLKNTPGKGRFSFEKDCATRGSLSKEDAAVICVEALDAVPEKEFVFEAVNGEETVSDWKKCFASLMEKSGQ